MTALFLAKDGVPVTLLEKGRIACEQSSRNWGWVRKQGRDPREIPAIKLSLDLWQELVTRVPEKIGWHQGGITYLAETDEDTSRFERWLVHARDAGFDSRMLSATETDTLLGQTGRRYKGALNTPSDARAEPRRAVPAFARYARSLGATIRERCAVRNLDTQAGRVKGVITEHGRIACNTVILAGGAWSRTFLDHLGHNLPQLQIKASVQRTAPAPLITQSCIGHSKVGFRRRQDGGYTLARSGSGTFEITPNALRNLALYLPMLKDEIGDIKLRLGTAFVKSLLASKSWADDQKSPFEKTRVLDPTPDHALLDEVLSNAKTIFPQLQDIEITERWAGMIDFLPDAIPVMSPVADIPGLILATGFSGHGFGIGPAAGKITAALATGKTPPVNTDAFAYERFTDGTTIRPYDWT